MPFSGIRRSEMTSVPSSLRGFSKNTGLESANCARLSEVSIRAMSFCKRVISRADSVWTALRSLASFSALALESSPSSVIFSFSASIFASSPCSAVWRLAVSRASFSPISSRSNFSRVTSARISLVACSRRSACSLFSTASSSCSLVFASSKGSFGAAAGVGGTAAGVAGAS